MNIESAEILIEQKLFDETAMIIALVLESNNHARRSYVYRLSNDVEEICYCERDTLSKALEDLHFYNFNMFAMSVYAVDDQEEHIYNKYL